MCTANVKSPKTFKEQKELLKQKGLIIENEEKCIEFLQSVNYYAFTAYLLPFMDKESGKIKENIPFSVPQKIYDFDRRMRILVLSIIEEIELYLRTQISYYHAHKYGSLGYTIPQNFNAKHDQKRFENTIQECIYKNAKTLVVKHHIDKYNGNFPLWVMIEFFSIGELSHFYSDMYTSDKKSISEICYNATYKQLDSWLRCLTVLRNKTAHYTRLYYWIFSSVPAVPENIDYQCTRKLFDQILMLKWLFKNQNRWNHNILNQLKNLIDEYAEYIKLNHIGFPEDWYSILIKY